MKQLNKKLSYFFVLTFNVVLFTIVYLVLNDYVQASLWIKLLIILFVILYISLIVLTVFAIGPLAKIYQIELKAHSEKKHRNKQPWEL